MTELVVQTPSSNVLHSLITEEKKNFETKYVVWQ